MEVAGAADIAVPDRGPVRGGLGPVMTYSRAVFPPGEKAGAHTHADMTEALNRGWAERDSRISMLLQEERAGVDIKVASSEIQAVLQKDG